MIDQRPAEKPWKKDYLLACLISFLTTVTLMMTNNAFPLYITSLRGSASYSGVLLAILTVAAVVSRFFCGELIDRTGCRRVVALGIIIYAASIAGYAFFPHLAAMAALRFIQGLSFAAIGTASGAAVAYIVPQRGLGAGISIYGLAQSVATAIGPYLGLSLIFGDDYRFVFWGGGGLALVMLVFSHFCQYECHETTAENIAKLEAAKAARGRLTAAAFLADHLEKKALIPTLIQGISNIAVSGILIYLVLYSADQAFARPGAFFLVASLTMVAVRVVMAPLADQARGVYLFIPAAAAGIACFLILAFTASTALYICAGVGYGVMHGVTYAMLNTVAIKWSPAHRRGAATATFMVGVDAGMGLGAVMFGLIIDSYGFRVMYCAAAGCVALWFILCCLFIINKKSRLAHERQAEAA